MCWSWVPAAWLGQRLATLREADARNGRYAALDYRFVAASTGALSEANRLQDDLPLIDVITGEAFQDTAATGKTQLAIVHLDFEAPSQARELLTALIANLAPGAQLLLCGCEPAAWAGPILALDDGEQLRSHPGIAQWQRLLTQLGLDIESPAPASDSLANDNQGTETSGAWWLSATLAAQTPLAALAKPLKARRRQVNQSRVNQWKAKQWQARPPRSPSRCWIARRHRRIRHC